MVLVGQFEKYQCDKINWWHFVLVRSNVTCSNQDYFSPFNTHQYYNYTVTPADNILEVVYVQKRLNE